MPVPLRSCSRACLDVLDAVPRRPCLACRRRPAAAPCCAACSVRTLNALGCLERRVGFLDTAAGLLEAALNVDPQHVPSLHELALVREAQVGAARLRLSPLLAWRVAAGCAGCGSEGPATVSPSVAAALRLRFLCTHLPQGRTKQARRLKQQAQWLSAQRRSALQEAAAQKLPAAAAPSSAPAPGSKA